MKYKASIKPTLSLVLLRGGCKSHPQCVRGHTLYPYLKVRSKCVICWEVLNIISADDFPPYLTIVIVGHVVGSLLLLPEQYYCSTNLVSNDIMANCRFNTDKFNITNMQRPVHQFDMAFRHNRERTLKAERNLSRLNYLFHLVD